MNYHDLINDVRFQSLTGSDNVSIFLANDSLYSPPEKALRKILAKIEKVISPEIIDRIKNDEINWKAFYKSRFLGLSIFANKNYYEVVPLKVPVETRVIICDSFHIKPLLASIEQQKKGVLVHFMMNEVRFFLVDPRTYEKNEVLLPGSSNFSNLYHLIKTKEELIDSREYMSFLRFVKIEINKFFSSGYEYLAFSGVLPPNCDDEGFTYFTKVNSYPGETSSGIPTKAISSFQRFMREDIKPDHPKDLIAPFVNKKTSCKIKKVEKLMRAINKNLVKRLYICLEDFIPGKISFDLKSRKHQLTLHQSHINLYKEDLLDDITELALDTGIRVRVVPRSFFPPGVSFIAV